MRILWERNRQAATARRYAEVTALNEEILTLDPDNYGALANVAGGYYETNRLSDSLNLALKAIRIFPDSNVYFIVASTFVKAGERDRAFAWLDQAVRGGFSEPSMIQANFGAFRDDPRYTALMQQASR